ncbi:MAG: hypothetical protein ABL958_05480 [Bdellovibrionia bacterium]
MRISKKSRNKIFLALILLVGCSTSSYKVENFDNGRTELIVSPDRVLLECEFITDYTGDIENAHGFMIHILDENNTVLTAVQTNVLGKEDCFRRINKISKILRGGRRITVGGLGDPNEPRKWKDRAYSFPNLGKYPGNGRVLQIISVWNEIGQCYDVYSGEEKPCPREEFPIRKTK